MPETPNDLKDEKETLKPYNIQIKKLKHLK